MARPVLARPGGVRRGKALNSLLTQSQTAGFGPPLFFVPVGNAPQTGYVALELTRRGRK
jgi:hypothetical protein